MEICILSTILAAYILPGIFIEIFKALSSARWKPIPGEILKTQVLNAVSRGQELVGPYRSDFLHIEYEYGTDKKKGNRIRFGSQGDVDLLVEKYHPGKKVEVYINESKNDSVLEPGFCIRYQWINMVSVFIVGALFLTTWIAFITRKF